MHLSSTMRTALEQSKPARVVVALSGYRQGSAIRARAQTIAPALQGFEESTLLLVDSSAWGQTGASPIVEREQFGVRTIFVRPGGLTGRGELLAASLEAGTLDYAIAHYPAMSPPFFIQDSLITPLLEALFGIPLRYPLVTERALSAGVAQYVVEADVWETDVARYGIDAWLTTEALLNGARVGAVSIPQAARRAKNTREHRTARTAFHSTMA